MKNYYTSLNFNKASINYVALHPNATAPTVPVVGQIWTDTTVPTSAIMKYWNGTSWIDLTASTGTDIYVNGLSFASSTGILSATRTGGQSTLTVNLDGRYLTQNQNINFTGELTGSGTTSISLTPTETFILNRTTTTTLNAASYFLFYDAAGDELSKLSWGTIDNYITELVNGSNTPWNLETSPGTNFADLTLTNGTLSSTVRFSGTTAEIQVSEQSGGVIQVGLPDDVTITNNLTVEGNLIVNGTQTILNTTELKVEDNIITLNSNVTGTPLTNAGIEVNRGSSPITSLIWNESTDRWTFTNDGTTFYNIPISSEYNFYTHPTQSGITLDGSGLQFVQDLTVNTLGHVTAATLGTIPTASTTVVGVTRLATNTEATTGASGVALQPSQVASFLDTRSYVTNITGSGTVNHNLNATAINVQFYDNSTGELIEVGVSKVDADNIIVNFDSVAPASTQVVILKIR